MKFRTLVLFAIILFLGSLHQASAQAADTVLGQLTNSSAESFAGGVSGDGRFVVFESRGNLATENPRNADNNREIFLFDYAQRRIFQITDTKVLLTDPTKAATFDNIKVEIANIKPVISNDGRWIAFGSNATTSTPTAPNSTDPGNFDPAVFNVSTTSGTTTTTTNPLTSDGNLEIWLYQVPATTAVNLSNGDELPVTNLSAGSFTRVTNTAASRLPVAGSTTAGAFVADDNHDADISDNGNIIAFVSTRNLVPDAATSNTDANDEIFTYNRTGSTISQLTSTPRGSVGKPIYNVAPTISGLGNRVAFASSGNNPVIGTPSSGVNTDSNEEVFYVNLTATGAPAASSAVQITTTTQVNPGDLVNLWAYGKRMSRDGRYIAFDSFADLTGGGAANQGSFALYVYDAMATTGAFRQIGPRSNADSAATGGDVAHYPTFSTDVDSTGAAQTALVFTTRQNIRPDGSIPANQNEGMNPNTARPAQIYSYLLNVSAGAAGPGFVQLTKLPTPNTFLASTQAITSNSVKRTVFNLALTETGNGNSDLFSEVFYLIKPDVIAQSPAASTSLFTGASRLPVTTASPAPTTSPTPQTPAEVQGLAPGMLALVRLSANAPVVAVVRTAVGSLQRNFPLPIELSGVTVTINGTAAGIKSVNGRDIEFVVPSALTLTGTSTPYKIVVNNNGAVARGDVVIVPARPDVFTNLTVPGPGGRARIVNATNTVQTREPFTIRTLRRRGGLKTPSVLRLYLTGVNGATAANIRIRIGSTEIPAAQIISNAVLVEPGVYRIDFTLPASLAGSGDQPIVVSVVSGGTEYFARLADTAPRLSIL